MHLMLLTRREWWLALLSGLLLALALPPLPTGPLAWVALIPLIAALDGTSPARAGRIGYTFGLSLHIASLYWIAFHVDIPTWLAIIGWIAASLILSLYTAGACAAMRLAARWTGEAWVWLVPVVWTAFEYLRYFTEFAFPWVIVGHTQARLLGLIQQADVWGVLGVSFWVVALNVIAYLAVVAARDESARVRGKAWYYAGTFLLVLVATATYGRFRMSEAPTRPQNIRIALVQPNISMATKWQSGNGLRASADTLRVQTMEIEPGSVDLVIWPETAIPDYLIYTPPGDSTGRRVVNPRYARYLHQLTTHTGVPLVAGVPAQDYPLEAQFNSVMVVAPESLTVQSYDKQVLVPFGEHVPYESVFGFLGKLNLGIAQWSQGSRVGVLRTNVGAFGVGVCFESVFPDLMSDFVRRGADFLVIVTNDAWFARTSLIYQHVAFGVFRAIENRVWIARDANTGISAIFDPWGRMVRRAPAFERKTIVGAIGHRERDTVYLRWGDWIGQVCLTMTAVVMIGGWWAGRRA